MSILICLLKDMLRILILSMSWSFQSTRPVRGGTDMSTVATALGRIFQSTRPVRGGTAGDFELLCPVNEFQSTRPVRGGTRTACGPKAL